MPDALSAPRLSRREWRGRPLNTTESVSLQTGSVRGDRHTKTSIGWPCGELTRLRGMQKQVTEIRFELRTAIPEEMRRRA